MLQGDTLAPFLFVVVLDAVLRDAQLTGYTLRRRQSSRSPEVRLPFLAFANDVELHSNNVADLYVPTLLHMYLYLLLYLP